MKTFKRLTAGLLMFILLISSMSIPSFAAMKDNVKNLRILSNDENGVTVAWDIDDENKQGYDYTPEYSTDKTHWKSIFINPDLTAIALRNDYKNTIKPNTTYYFRVLTDDGKKKCYSNIISAKTKSELKKFDWDELPHSEQMHIITPDYILTITDTVRKYACLQYVSSSFIKNGVLTLPSTVGGYSIKKVGRYILDKVRKAKKENTIKKLVVSDGIEELYNYTVTLEPLCFMDLPNLKEIILPNNIIIGDAMFSGCKKLEKVTFKGKIKAMEGLDPGIYPSTFSGCSSLREIKLPSNVKFISDFAFSGCTKLEKITLPSKLELIKESAFENCKSLKKITLPSTLKKIGKKAFYNCKSLTGKMKLPKNLKEVGDGAFAFCYGLTGFRIADGNKYFSQKGGVLFNKDKTKIYCYLSGKETKEYKMPSTVKSISKYSFVGTKHLKKLIFSDKVKSVPDVVFWKSNIKYIVFSKSVKKVRDLPEADTLKSITVKNKNCEMPVGITGNYRGKNITVYGYKNSTAQKFAKKAKLKFVAIK